MTEAVFTQRAATASASKVQAGSSAAGRSMRLGDPADCFEQEADRVADQVMAGGALNRTASGSLSRGNSIQRTAAGPARLTDIPSVVHETIAESGAPLNQGTRNFFEPRFGYDFGKVRIHSGGKASESAREVAAHAYAVGHHIVFGANHGSPEGGDERKLMAHELAHVVQQSPEGTGTGQIQTLSTGAPGLSRKADDSEQTQKTYTLTLKYPPSQQEHIQAASPHDAGIKVGWFISQVEAHIIGGKDGHRYLVKLHEDQWATSRIADALGGHSLPPMDIWAPSDSEVAAGRAAIAQGDVEGAARHAQAAADKAHEAEDKLYEYREGTIAGAGRAEFGLEVVVAVSAAVVAVGTAGIAAGAGGTAALTGLATGATAGGVPGTVGLVAGGAYGATQQVTQQAAEVHGGMRKKVDWSGIGVDAAIGLLTGHLGGKFGGVFVSRFLKNPATAGFGRKIAVEMLGDLLAGRSGSIMQGAVRMVYDDLTGQKKLTVDGLINRTVKQLFDPKAAFLDVILGAAKRRLAQSAPPASTPPPPPDHGNSVATPSAEPAGNAPAKVPASVPELAAPEPESTAPEPAASAPALVAPEPVASVPVLEPPSVAAAPAEPTSAGAPSEETRTGMQFHEIDLPEGEGPAPQLYRGAKPVDRIPGTKRVKPRFGEASNENSGTGKRTGVHFNEFNAAEITQGLRVNYDPVAGRPRVVDYRVDGSAALNAAETDRAFSQDASTEGAQSADSAYVNSGYDRGHLGQREAFKGSADTEGSVDQFTNVVPMKPELNRGAGSPWRAAEAQTIQWATQFGAVKVRVEVNYDANPPRLRDGTPIPSGFRRVVTGPSGQVLQDLSCSNL